MRKETSIHASLSEIYGKISNNKWEMLVVSVIVFTFFVWVLWCVDLLPERPASHYHGSISVASAVSAFPIVGELEKETNLEKPVRVVVEKIGVDVNVNNPYETDVYSLDKSLLSGVVRYPTSAVLGENGNVVIFGHSSYLPVVRNKNFKAFNGLEKLSAGEIIKVYGREYVYEYAVDRVYEADATDTQIPLIEDSKRLTLSTCNTFGNLDDRYVVEAYFIGSKKISS